MSETDFDVAVLGGGTGGYAAALRAAQLGKRVVLIERDARLGGTCLLRGCIPTKALLRSAEVLDTVNRASTWGITASGEADWAGMTAFRDTVVDRLVTGLTHLIRDRRIQVIHGQGRLLPGPLLTLGEDRITATDVVLATGSQPRMLTGLAVSERILTSDQALALDRIPSSAVVIGGGAIGLEFASMYRSLGAEVTLLEALPRIAPLEDEEISTWLGRAFKKRRIATHAGVRVGAVDEGDDAVTVAYGGNGDDKQARAEICLMAVGRAPCSSGMGYEEAGVVLDRGFVVVDPGLRTSVDHVWAIGDVSSTPLQFAHVAFAEGIAVAERIAGLDPPPIDYDGVARVTFSTPEVASVGLTEVAATERGLDPVVSRFQFQGLGKAQILAEGGLTKMVTDREGRILGVHMVGPHVTDLVSEAMLMTNAEHVAGDLARFIHPHPTLSEALGESLLAVAGKPLHG